MMLGNKLGMTQIFNSDGSRLPVTVISAGPCYVTQLIEKNNSIQIGYGKASKRSLNHSTKAYFEKLQLPPFKVLKEFSVQDVENYEIGQSITLEQFEIGQKVKVTSNSIGKGFSGCKKRHHFTRGPMAHGSKNHSQPGSIGAGTTPGRVFPGKKMPGRLGGNTVTIKNLQIADIDIENNLLVVKGSIPGKTGNLVKIY